MTSPAPSFPASFPFENKLNTSVRGAVEVRIEGVTEITDILDGNYEPKAEYGISAIKIYTPHFNIQYSYCTTVYS